MKTAFLICVLSALSMADGKTLGAINPDVIDAVAIGSMHAGNVAPAALTDTVSLQRRGYSYSKYTPAQVETIRAEQAEAKKKYFEDRSDVLAKFGKLRETMTDELDLDAQSTRDSERCLERAASSVIASRNQIKKWLNSLFTDKEQLEKMHEKCSVENNCDETKKLFSDIASSFFNLDLFLPKTDPNHIKTMTSGWEGSGVVSTAGQSEVDSLPVAPPTGPQVQPSPVPPPTGPQVQPSPVPPPTGPQVQPSPETPETLDELIEQELELSDDLSAPQESVESDVSVPTLPPNFEAVDDDLAESDDLLLETDPEVSIEEPAAAAEELVLDDLNNSVTDPAVPTVLDTEDIPATLVSIAGNAEATSEAISVPEITPLTPEEDEELLEEIEAEEGLDSNLLSNIDEPEDVDATVPVDTSEVINAEETPNTELGLVEDVDDAELENLLNDEESLDSLVEGDDVSLPEVESNAALEEELETEETPAVEPELSETSDSKPAVIEEISNDDFENILEEVEDETELSVEPKDETSLSGDLINAAGGAEDDDLSALESSIPEDELSLDNFEDEFVDDALSAPASSSVASEASAAPAPLSVASSAAPAPSAVASLALAAPASSSVANSAAPASSAVASLALAAPASSSVASSAAPAPSAVASLALAAPASSSAAPSSSVDSVDDESLDHLGEEEFGSIFEDDDLSFEDIENIAQSAASSVSQSSQTQSGEVPEEEFDFGEVDDLFGNEDALLADDADTQPMVEDIPAK